MSRACVRVRQAERADVGAFCRLDRSVDTTSGIFSGRACSTPTPRTCRRLGEILDEAGRTLLVAVDDPGGALAGLLSPSSTRSARST